MGATQASASALRQHIRAERIKLPEACSRRSLVWTVLFAGRPFAWLSAAVVLAGSGLSGWLVWPLAAVALLIAQRHLQTLVHDASHGFYHRKSALNDPLADWLAAGWIGMTVGNYRRIHFQHHAHNGSAADPEHVSLATVAETGGLLGMVLRYACLREALRLVRKYYGAAERAGGAAQAPSGHLHILGSQLLLATLCLAAGMPAVYLLWLYLAVSWSPLLSRLRFLVEHPGESDITVSTRAGWWERLLFAPLNFNLHFEHHCWPGVPPYRLPQAHRFLRAAGFYERHPEYANEGFVGALLRRRQEQRAAGEALA